MIAPIGYAENLDWWDEARCRDGSGSLTSLFFSENLDDITRAKEFCAECPVKAPCLAGALARREPWGVWGGHLVWRGRVVTQKRRRGRPPLPRDPDTGQIVREAGRVAQIRAHERRAVEQIECEVAELLAVARSA